MYLDGIRRFTNQVSSQTKSLMGTQRCFKEWFMNCLCISRKTIMVIESVMKITILILFRMGIFGAAHGWGEAKRAPVPKICHTYPTMKKFSTVIPYLKKIQKIYKSRDISVFSPEISKFVISRSTDINWILMHHF